jgi:phosphatidate cytidylyltransferase
VLRARLATAAVAIPSLLALIFLAPPWGLAIVVSALAIAAMTEYAGLAFRTQPVDRWLTVVLGVLVILAALDGPGPRLTAALALVVAAGFARVVLFRSDLERGLADIGLIAVGVLYVGLFMPHFIWLHRVADGPGWLTFVIATGMAGDTAGYFVGRAFGRRRLIPRVSPGKTVEGAIGILAASLLAGVAAKLILRGDRGWKEILALAFVMGVIGQIGDLSESVMKRAFGAKESGWILPGHGGVLDRIDSLLFPVTLVYYYLTLPG